MKQGYLPEALVNYLIATSYTDETLGEVFSIEDAADEFEIDDISKSPAIYDIKYLNWFNREYIEKLEYADVLAKSKDFSKFLLANTKYDPDKVKLMIEGIQDSINKFEEIDLHLAYFFEDFSLSNEKARKT